MQLAHHASGKGKLWSSLRQRVKKVSPGGLFAVVKAAVGVRSTTASVPARVPRPSPIITKRLPADAAEAVVFETAELPAGYVMSPSQTVASSSQLVDLKSKLELFQRVRPML